MPARSDDPLRRVTLNLYEADCTALEKFYGHGWTTNIREIMHTHVQTFTNHEIKYRDARTRRLTLGDLEDD